MKKFCAILVLLTIAFGCGGKGPASTKQREMNLFIWSAYITKEIVAKFETRTGIKVHYDTYDSNEALLEKMQSGVADYDVIVPSDYMVRIMTKQNLLETLDHNKVPNIKNLTSRFQNPPFDPKNAHSIAYVWGTSGIGYNKTKVTDPVDSWAILWNPKYKDRILMLEDEREVFGVALKWKGHSLNTTDPAQLQEAKTLLMQQKPLVKTYTSSNFDEILLSGDVWLAHGWSGQLAKAADQNKDLAYIVPKEGATIWVDNMAISIAAKHKEEAYEFINFCLDPQIGAEIVNYNGYASPNQAARPFIKPEYLNDPARYPTEQTLSKCEFLQDLGETSQVIDRLWTEVKSR